MINNYEEESLPTSLDELIDWLDRAYPDKIVTAEQSPYDQGKLHGRVELIRVIKQIQKELEQ